MAADVSFRFDRFELFPEERILLRDGEAVPLRARAFDLLAALAERRGHLVTKSELMDKVWPHLIVEENNIAAQVAALRKALRSDVIVTIPGRGYRLVDSTKISGSSGRADADSAALAMPDSPVRPPAVLFGAPPLFGREDDLTRLRSALASPGCVTLVGPGGVGKTSMARALRFATPDPTFWIDLAALSEPHQLLPALSRGVGLTIDGLETLPGATQELAVAQALGNAQLLVLDNAEHLVDAVAGLVMALTKAVPRLRLLVTSQRPLAIEGERIERIDPLALPGAHLPDTEARAIGAVAMFVDRIRAADPRYQVAPESMPLLRRLCAELDGLPLALEMAAARVPLLGLQRVSEALTERFTSLRHAKRNLPDRHRSLQALLDWSYHLLTPEEQQLFRALGVFSSDGFTLDLAVSIAAGEDRWETIDRIALLVDRSLIAVDHADPPRYRLLETMRRYALARLREANEEAVARTRQGAALELLFAGVHELARSPSHEPQRQVATDEMENARELLAWARTHDAALATRLSAYVVGQASLGSWRAEAFSWLAACEPLLAREDAIEPRWRALWWRHFAAQTLLFSGQLAADRTQRAAEVCRAANEPLHLAYSLIYLSFATSEPSAASDAALDEAEVLLDAHPEWLTELRVLCLNARARACMKKGDLESAEGLLGRALNMAVAAKLHTATRFTSMTLADVLRRTDRCEQALATLDWGLHVIDAPFGLIAQQCSLMRLRVKFQLGRFDEAMVEAVAVLAECRRYAMVAVYDVLALGLAQAARPRSAALVIGRSRQVLAERGILVSDAPEADLPRATASALEALGSEAFARLVEQGRGLDDGQLERLLKSDDSAVG